MTDVLRMHWSYDRSLAIPALAAVSVLLTVVLGLLKLRGSRPPKKSSAQTKPLFPKNRVFLVEKSDGDGCARPCATGPLFQFDTGENHESLDFVDSYCSDANMGVNNMPLFVSGYDNRFEQQGLPRHDMFGVRPPESASQPWKQQFQLSQYQGEMPLMQSYSARRLEPDMYTQPTDPDPSYAFTKVVEFGDDDSDSGASLPSQNIESLELVDVMNAGPIPNGASDMAALRDHANPFATVPPVSDVNCLGMSQDSPLDAIIPLLEPLDPTYALSSSRTSHLSEGLRSAQRTDREPAHNKPDFVMNPEQMMYDSASMPLPLSNPSYTVGGSDYMEPGNVPHDSQGDVEALGFTHLNSADAGPYFYGHNQALGDGSFMDSADSGVLPIPNSFNARRKPSAVTTSPTMKQRRAAPYKKMFNMNDGVEADFAGVSGFTHAHAHAGDLMPSSASASAVPSLTSNLSDVEAASSASSTGVSPKSPKETDGSGDDSVARYRCPHCDTAFRIRGYLTRHIKKHADVMMYNCPFFNPDDEHRCHATGGFSRRDTYKTHLKARHFLYPRGTGRKDRYRMPGNCSGCGERFNNNEEWIETHIQTGLCSGQVFGAAGDDTANGLNRGVSVSSSPTSDAEINHEGFIVDSGPYQRDFQRHNMLMTHVQ